MRTNEENHKDPTTGLEEAAMGIRAPEDILNEWLSPMFPKREGGHLAAREIEALRTQLAEAQKRIEKTDRELYDSIEQTYLATKRAEALQRERDELKRNADGMCCAYAAALERLAELGEDKCPDAPGCPHKRILAALTGEECVEAADKDLSRQLRKGVDGIYTNKERVEMALQAAVTKAKELAG